MEERDSTRTADVAFWKSVKSSKDFLKFDPRFVSIGKLENNTEATEIEIQIDEFDVSFHIIDN